MLTLLTSLYPFVLHSEQEVQTWIDTIQVSAPGSVILPILTFRDGIDEHFLDSNGEIRAAESDSELKRRVEVLTAKLKSNENARIHILNTELEQLKKDGLTGDARYKRLKQSLARRPKIQYDEIKICGTPENSKEAEKYASSFEKIKDTLVTIATKRHDKDERNKGGTRFFTSIGAEIPEATKIITTLVIYLKKRRENKTAARRPACASRGSCSPG